MISPVGKEEIRVFFQGGGGRVGLFIPSEIEQEILWHFSETTLSFVKT